MCQRILNFPLFSMQLRIEDRTYPFVIESILSPVKTILQLGKRNTIWVKSQIYTDNEATGIKNLLDLYKIMRTFLFAQRFRQTKTTDIWSKSAFF